MTITVHGLREETGISAYAYETQTPEALVAAHGQAETVLDTVTRGQSTMVVPVAQVTIAEPAAETVYFTEMITRPRHHHHQTEDLIEGEAIISGAPTGSAAEAVTSVVPTGAAAVLPAVQSVDGATTTVTQVIKPGEHVSGADAGAAVAASTQILHVPSASVYEDIYAESNEIVDGRHHHHHKPSTMEVGFEHIAVETAGDAATSGPIELVQAAATSLSAVETVAANTDGDITTEFATVTNFVSGPASSAKWTAVDRFDEAFTVTEELDDTMSATEASAPEPPSSVVTQVVVFNTTESLTNETGLANASAATAGGLGPLLNSSLASVATVETAPDATMTVIATDLSPGASAGFQSAVATQTIAGAPFANSTAKQSLVVEGTAVAPSQNISSTAMPLVNSSSPAAEASIQAPSSNSTAAPFANTTVAQQTVTKSIVVLPAENTSIVVAPAVHSSAPEVTETVTTTIVSFASAASVSEAAAPFANSTANSQAPNNNEASAANGSEVPTVKAPFSNATAVAQTAAVTTVHDVVDTTHTITVTEKCSSCSNGHTVYTSTSVCPITTSTNVYPAPPPPTHATMTYAVSSSSLTWSTSSVSTVSPSLVTYPATYTTHTSYSTSTSVCTDEPEPVTHTSVETICKTFTIPASSAWEYPKTHAPQKRAVEHYPVDATTAHPYEAPSWTISTIWATSCSTTVFCTGPAHECEHSTTSTQTHMIPYSTTTCEETSSTAPPKTYAPPPPKTYAPPPPKTYVPPPSSHVESSTPCTSSAWSSTKVWETTTTPCTTSTPVYVHHNTSTPCTTSTPVYVHHNTSTPCTSTKSEHHNTTIPVYPLPTTVESVPSQHYYPTQPTHANKTQPIVPGPTQPMMPGSMQPPYANTTEPGPETSTAHETSSSTYYQETTVYVTKPSQPAETPVSPQQSPVPSVCVPVQQIGGK